MEKKAKKVEKRVGDDVNALECYLKDINKVPLLSRDEECKIAREAKACKIARDKLISANLRFVVKIAKKYQGQGLPLEDLINEGNIGLIKAAKNYDTERGYHFISYAVWWIRQSILMGIAEKSRMIRMPLHWNSRLIQIEHARQTALDNKHINENMSEIAEKLKMKTEKVNELILMAQETISLEQPTNDETNPSMLGDFLESDQHPSPEDYVLNKSLQDEIEKILNTLTNRESAILKARYGLDDGVPKSLEEIGRRFNISKEGVRQIESRALAQLKSPEKRDRLENYVA